jgi:GxxExxY protein
VEEDEVAREVVGAALAVHRALGPGLLESVYGHAMAIELTRRRMPFLREPAVDAWYAGEPLGVAFRADFVVAGKVLIELKAIAAIEPVHLAQVLTYLRLTRMKLGLLLNFNTTLMKHGVRRIVNAL